MPLSEQLPRRKHGKTPTAFGGIGCSLSPSECTADDFKRGGGGFDDFEPLVTGDVFGFGHLATGPVDLHEIGRLRGAQTERQVGLFGASVVADCDVAARAHFNARSGPIPGGGNACEADFEVVGAGLDGVVAVEALGGTVPGIVIQQKIRGSIAVEIRDCRPILPRINTSAGYCSGRPSRGDINRAQSPFSGHVLERFGPGLAPNFQRGRTPAGEGGPEGVGAPVQIKIRGIEHKMVVPVLPLEHGRRAFFKNAAFAGPVGVRVRTGPGPVGGALKQVESAGALVVGEGNPVVAHPSQRSARFLKGARALVDKEVERPLLEPVVNRGGGHFAEDQVDPAVQVEVGGKDAAVAVGKTEHIGDTGEPGGVGRPGLAAIRATDGVIVDTGNAARFGVTGGDVTEDEIQVAIPVDVGDEHVEEGFLQFGESRIE